MTTSFRAEQIGSLLRPRALLEAREEYAAGRISYDALRITEDRAVIQALELQQGAGVDVYSDGEYRRTSFLSDMADAVDGFIDEQPEMAWEGDEQNTDKRSTAKVVGGRLAQRRRLAEQETAFLAEHAPGPYKVTVPDTTYFAQACYRRGLTDRYYPARAALLDELADIIHGELAALVESGVPYVQLDAPGFTFFSDDRLRAGMRSNGVDPDELFEAAVEADRRCLEGIRRAGVTVGIHLCRGNSRSRWLAEGGYDAIAERLFNSLPVDRFLLEYDTPRAGDFAPLRHVPDDATVVLGLLTTKQGAPEQIDDLARRVDEATAYVPLERLAVSPQCGFASVAEGNLLSWDEQRRKLEIVTETARKVWGRN